MINRNPSKRDLRIFSLVLAIFAGGFATLAFYNDKSIVAYVLYALSAGGLLAAALLPAIIKPAYIVFSYIGLVLGWINTRLLLGIIFYLVFTPISLFFRLTGRDILERRFDKNAATYWKDKADAERGRERYLKQF